MHRVALVLSSLVLAALVTGCGGLVPGSSTRPSASPSPSVAPSVDVAALTATAWRLVAIGDEALAGPVERSIAFGVDGSVAGSSGCNTFGGPVSLGPGTLTVGELVQTDTACADPVAQRLEGRYLAALTGASAWRLGADDTLVIDGGAERLTFVSD